MSISLGFRVADFMGSFGTYRLTAKALFGGQGLGLGGLNVTVLALRRGSWAWGLSCIKYLKLSAQVCARGGNHSRELVGVLEYINAHTVATESLRTASPKQNHSNQPEAVRIQTVRWLPTELRVCNAKRFC